MAGSQTTQIHLPPPKQKGNVSLEEAIARRRSTRNFTPEPISKLQLSQILWAAQGITNAPWKHRSVPSAGATYPLEIFVICGTNCIEQISDGVHHYNTARHSLTPHHKGDVSLELARAALGQKLIYQAPLDIVICALFIMRIDFMIILNPG